MENYSVFEVLVLPIPMIKNMRRAVKRGFISGIDFYNFDSKSTIFDQNSLTTLIVRFSNQINTRIYRHWN